MAKHEVHGPDKDEMLQYQAEDMARRAMMEMPAYKEMVGTMKGRLEEMQKEAQGMMGKRLPMKKGRGLNKGGEDSEMASVAPPRMAR